jgi:hypothetical protein
MGLWLRRMTRRTRSAVPQRGRSRCSSSSAASQAAPRRRAAAEAD